MYGIILQILKSAKKDSLFLGMTIATIIVTMISFFLGATALVEEWEMKVVYAAGFSRLVLMLGMIVFISFYVKRLFENGEIEVILSRPISRTKIVLSIIIGFSMLFTLLMVPISLILVSILEVKIKYCAVWILTVLLEGFMVVGFSTFFALLVASSVHGLLISFAVYGTSRVIGSFVAYIHVHSVVDTVKGGLYSISEGVLKAISVVFPRLDLFGKTSWLLYGDYTMSSLLTVFAQFAVFSAVIFFAIIFDFRRKQF